MMEARLATSPGPGRSVNEDTCFWFRGLAGVLDGVTGADDLDYGCIHGTAWYVGRLAARLVERHSADPSLGLVELLAHAIERVRGDHGETCRLDVPQTPAATVCLLREGKESVDYLVLADTTLVLDRGTQPEIVTDKRLQSIVAQIRSAQPETRGRADGITVGKWEHINREGGYWIAAADPTAASHALIGSVPITGPGRLRRAALLTDGASCAVDTLGLFGWDGLLDVLDKHGVQELITQVRQAEIRSTRSPGEIARKRHDDATVVFCQFEEDQP